MPKNNIHKDHRKRMQERALKEGLSGFSEHELLELALFHSRPRVDTNPIAHELLNTFGSVKNVLDAKIDELCRVEGIGASSAILLRLVAELMKRYEACTFEKTTCFNEIQKIGEHLHPCFIGLNVERLYMMMFNNRMNLIDCVLISEGTVNCTDSSLRKMSECVLNKNASSVVLAHNHPGGVAYPSDADLIMTSTIENFLRAINVTLLEHFIFNDRRYYPVMLNHFSKFRPSPVTGNVENEFYDRFYHGVTGDCEVRPLFAENAEKNEVVAENIIADQSTPLC